MELAVINVLLAVSFLITAILSTLMALRSELLSSKFLSASAYGAVVWIFFMIIFMNAKNLFAVITATKMLYVAGAIIITNFVYFAYTFLQEKLKSRTTKIIIIGVPVLLFLPLIIFTNLVISDVEFMSDANKIVKFGYLYYFYVAYMVVWSIFGYCFLLKKSSHTVDNIQKRQLFWIGGGTIFSVTFGLVFDLILPMFGNFDFFWLGPVLVTFFVIFASYAIAKHHLFNVKVITTELFSTLLFIALVVKFVLSESIGQFLLNGGVALSSGIFGLLLIRSVWKEVRTKEKLQVLTKKLEKANTELERVSAAKSEFVSIVSHQLRTPLTAVKGYLSMLREGSYGALKEVQQSALKKVFQSSERLISLVNDLLNLNRIEEGRIVYNFAAVDLTPMVDEVIEDLKTLADLKKIKLSWIKPHGLPKVWADADKLRQVIINLIDNAIKYTEQGQVSVTLRVGDERLEVGGGKREKEVLVLEVRDTGVGMDQEEQTTLFKKFVRGEGGRMLYTSGTGLGLYVAGLIMEALHGEISGASEGQGKGSVFAVKIPLEKSA